MNVQYQGAIREPTTTAYSTATDRKKLFVCKKKRGKYLDVEDARKGTAETTQSPSRTTASEVQFPPRQKLQSIENETMHTYY